MFLDYASLIGNFKLLTSTCSRVNICTVNSGIFGFLYWQSDTLTDRANTYGAVTAYMYPLNGKV